ncbi:unnamed protein product [Lactuca virosa]|uniref:Late embryogenesis abundant protein LEA-2 subgroup domain-containing protein n=1 Tax=Lactuca virosa TaxID=75947 RepID=A0AAU9LCU6_9ASTR|nr:unnamed protein product [Lactuca virosa]
MADQSMHVTGNPAPSATGHRNPATVYPYDSPAINAPQIQAPPASKLRIHKFFIFLGVSIFITGLLSLITWRIWLSFIGYPQFQFIVRNPNPKISVYCDHIRVAIIYHFCSISETTVPPFLQETKNETAIRARFTFSGKKVRYYYDDIGGGFIKIDLWMIVRVKPSVYGASRTRLRVYCHDLTILVSSKTNGGALVDSPKKCWVDSAGAFVKIKPPKLYHCSFRLF